MKYVHRLKQNAIQKRLCAKRQTAGRDVGVFMTGNQGLRIPMEKSLLLAQLKVHTASLLWPAAL